MDKDNLWTRRANSNKLSLSTSGGGNGQNDSFGRNDASSSRRFGGNTSSHGNKTSNPFNTSVSAASLASPTSASSAFGLGSGAFASFGSARTPKTPGNPFDLAMKGSFGSSTPAVTPGGKGASEAPPTAGAATTRASSSATQAGTELSKQHPLRHQWVFWYRPPISKSNGYQIDYEKTLHPTNSMASVEDFFSSYRYLKRPSELAQMADYHLFKKGVRPIWEDEENRKGGKWVVRLEKGVADRYWEDLCLAMVGDQFAEASEEVCGAVVSIRNGEDILSIWTATNGGRNIKIRETMKRLLAFPTDTKVEWKSHDSSIQQRTAVEESRRDKASNNNNHNERRNKSSQHGTNHHSHNDNPKQGNSGPSWRGAPESASSSSLSANPLPHSSRQDSESRFFPRSATTPSLHAPSEGGSPTSAWTPQSSIDEAPSARARYTAFPTLNRIRTNFAASPTPAARTPSVPNDNHSSSSRRRYHAGTFPNPLAPQSHTRPQLPPPPPTSPTESPTRQPNPLPSSATTSSVPASGVMKTTRGVQSSNWRQHTDRFL